mmetsp:Transcript_7747/g.19390  ORF Transcript_7747/g.19390 Transcript_7747/m.19390 type:complete len:203 (-) Transcript_7747:28-636(-)
MLLDEREDLVLLLHKGVHIGGYPPPWGVDEDALGGLHVGEGVLSLLVGVECLDDGREPAPDDALAVLGRLRSLGDHIVSLSDGNPLLLLLLLLARKAPLLGLGITHPPLARELADEVVAPVVLEVTFVGLLDRLVERLEPLLSLLGQHRVVEAPHRPPPRRRRPRLDGPEELLGARPVALLPELVSLLGSGLSYCCCCCLLR